MSSCRLHLEDLLGRWILGDEIYITVLDLQHKTVSGPIRLVSVSLLGMIRSPWMSQLQHYIPRTL